MEEWKKLTEKIVLFVYYAEVKMESLNPLVDIM